MRNQKVSSGWGGKEESSSDVFSSFFTYQIIVQREMGSNTVNSEIFANCVKTYIGDVKNSRQGRDLLISVND